MDSLARKPNLLFLIAIRAPTFPIIVILNKQLSRIPFDVKFRKALVKTYETSNPRIEYSKTYIYLPNKHKKYLHSFDDKPAVLEKSSDGSQAQAWYFMDNRHRDGDKPAYIYFKHKNKGKWTYRWFLHGLEHRDGDEPSSIYDAVYDPDGIRIKYDRLEWCKNGEKHREGGPAILDWNGDEQWYQNDVYHRLDGPAVIMSEPNEDIKRQEYWEYGLQCFPSEDE